MNFVFTDNFREDEEMLRRENPKYLHKLFQLLFAIDEHPFQGIGQPEALKHDQAGFWSRRITDKHRLVYKVEGEDTVIVVSCYGHYGDK